MNLYQISQNYRSLIDKIIEQDGIVNPDDEKALSEYDTTLEAKADSYCCVMRELDADINGYDTEIKRLTALKKSTQSTFNNFKKRLSNALKAVGKDSLRTEKFALSFKKSTQTRYDLDKLPKKYCKVEYKADVATIKDLLSSGMKVRGAWLEELQNLQVK